jgi:hypothetical protein
MISYDEIRPVINRLRFETVTPADMCLYLRFEMQEIMKVLPPDVPDNKSDGFHASCCALRALSVIYQLERTLKSSEPSTDKV